MPGGEEGAQGRGGPGVRARHPTGPACPSCSRPGLISASSGAARMPVSGAPREWEPTSARCCAAGTAPRCLRFLPRGPAPARSRGPAAPPPRSLWLRSTWGAGRLPCTPRALGCRDGLTASGPPRAGPGGHPGVLAHGIALCPLRRASPVDAAHAALGWPARRAARAPGVRSRTAGPGAGGHSQETLPRMWPRFPRLGNGELHVGWAGGTVDGCSHSDISHVHVLTWHPPSLGPEGVASPVPRGRPPAGTPASHGPRGALEKGGREDQLRGGS